MVGEQFDVVICGCGLIVNNSKVRVGIIRFLGRRPSRLLILVGIQVHHLGQRGRIGRSEDDNGEGTSLLRIGKIRFVFGEYLRKGLPESVQKERSHRARKLGFGRTAIGFQQVVLSPNGGWYPQTG